MLLVGIAIVPFFVARLALLLFHPKSFAALSAGEIAMAFVNGLRFDLNILLVALVVPLSMMNLPFPFLGRRWFNTWAWIGFIPLVPLSLVLGGDVIYFGHVQRHIADELLKIGNDFSFLADEAFTSFLPALFAVIGAMTALAWAWRWVLSRELRPSRYPMVTIALLATGCAVGIRGTVDRKPIGLIDAYRSGSTAFGNLSLNGIFSASRASAEIEIVEHRFFDDVEALHTLGLEDTTYPAVRRNDDRTPTGLNLVIVLLESWDPRYMNSYDANGSGVTPHFDAFASAGRKFEKFYAASQRSVESIQAVLTGIPPITGVPTLGWGLKLSNITQLGSVAQRHGYQALFVQSSMRRSYRLDAVAQSLGFDNFYGSQDIPMRRDYPPPACAKWGWDYETLMFALERMDAFDSPFISVVFTGSTHSPYPDTGPEFRSGEHQAHGEDGFRDILRYSDWALGEFLREARTRPWYDRTAFVVLSDHVWRNAATEDIRDEFRIPLAILAPGIVEPGVETRVGSHTDLLPTFFDLLGFQEPYAAMGSSLLEDTERFAVMKKGDLMGITSQDGVVTHSLLNRLEASSGGKGDPLDLDSLERRLLATIQVTSELLFENRWMPGEGTELGEAPAMDLPTFPHRETAALDPEELDAR